MVTSSSLITSPHDALLCCNNNSCVALVNWPVLLLFRERDVAAFIKEKEGMQLFQLFLSPKYGPTWL